jgi:hypothetical protein
MYLLIPFYCIHAGILTPSSNFSSDKLAYFLLFYIFLIWKKYNGPCHVLVIVLSIGLQEQ